MAAGLAAVRLDDDARRMKLADAESEPSQSTCRDKLHDPAVFQLVWGRPEECGGAAGLRHFVGSAQGRRGKARGGTLETTSSGHIGRLLTNRRKNHRVICGCGWRLGKGRSRRCVIYRLLPSLWRAAEKKN